MFKTKSSLRFTIASVFLLLSSAAVLLNGTHTHYSSKRKAQEANDPILDRYTRDD